HGREGFSRSASLMAFLMTTPGIPCIYYGDEIGMPGGNDPDNRRMMVFDQWDEDQSRLQEITSNLVNLRRSNLALAYGDLVVLQNDGQTFAYARKWFDEVVVVIFSSRAGTVTISLPEWIQDRSLARSVLGHETEAAGQRLTVIFEEPGAAVLSGT
ncbi:MAG: alpha-amylase family glycosyl hydrolase, partial [Bacteroidota bacterium]